MPVRIGNGLLQPVFEQKAIGQSCESIVLGLIRQAVSQATMFNGNRSHVSGHFKPAVVLEIRLMILAEENQYQANQHARRIQHWGGPARPETQLSRPFPQSVLGTAANKVLDENYFPRICAGAQRIGNIF